MKTAIFTYPGDVFTFPGKIENFHISRRHVFTYTVDEFCQIFTFTGATFSHIPAKIFTYMYSRRFHISRLYKACNTHKQVIRRLLDNMIYGEGKLTVQ